MKLKDFVTQKVNKRNFQVSLDIKKRELSKKGIDIDDLLEQSIDKFKRGDF